MLDMRLPIITRERLPMANGVCGHAGIRNPAVGASLGTAMGQRGDGSDMAGS